MNLHNKPCAINGRYHTCCIDDSDIEYCVFCLWKYTENLNITEIHADNLYKLSEINWGAGMYVKDVIHLQNDHFRRITEAKMEFPILVLYKDNQYIILDGCHRLAKHYMFGTSQYIKCKLVTAEILEKTRIYNIISNKDELLNIPKKICLSI